jgi:hypothetical protein
MFANNEVARRGQKIRIVLDLTEYDASLLGKLMEQQQKQAKQIRAFVHTHGGGIEPLPQTSGWERLAEQVLKRLAEAKHV